MKPLITTHVNAFPPLWKMALALVVVTAFLSTPQVYANEEYIKALDITVLERDEGDVVILKIGRFSPFRRYSWFRAGDVIENVDGVKTTIYVLHALHSNQDPHIKYRRDNGLTAMRQISLEKPVYGPPAYINYE